MAGASGRRQPGGAAACEGTRPTAPIASANTPSTSQVAIAVVSAVKNALASRGDCAVLAAGALGQHRHNDEGNDRDQPDEKERLEHCEDPANGHENQPY